MNAGQLIAAMEKVAERTFDRRIEQMLGELLGSTPQAHTRPTKSRRPGPPKWTEAEKQQVVRDAWSGMSMSQMAKKYGRSVGAIRLRLYGKKAGLMNNEKFLRQALQDTA